MNRRCWDLAGVAVSEETRVGEVSYDRRRFPIFPVTWSWYGAWDWATNVDKLQNVHQICVRWFGLLNFGESVQSWSCPWLGSTSQFFRHVHESNKLKKSFSYKDKQNHLRRSSIVYKLTCTCGSNYIGRFRRNLITRINEHKFDQRSEVCQHLLPNPKHRFNFKQPEILGSIVCHKKLHLLESLLIQQHQPELNIDDSSIPYCFSTHNGVYDVIQYECLKIASLFFSF